jgi:hypothetical protein
MSGPGASRASRRRCRGLIALVAIVVGTASVMGAGGLPPTAAFAGERAVGAPQAGAVAQARERGPRRGVRRDRAKPVRRKAAPATETRGIDTSHVWRGDTEVFAPGQLVRLERILRTSTCRNEKVGCTYDEAGKPASEASFAFRLIPWKVSKHKSYLVRHDRCGAGGCDEGLFVQIDGQWRLVTETFGILERASSTTLGFNDLRFTPRGRPTIRLVWDGDGYRRAPPVD